MTVFGRIEKAIQAFKGAPYYSRLNDGTPSYNYEVERHGVLGVLGIGSPFYTPSENLKTYYKRVFFLQDCINLYADMASQVNIQEVNNEGNVIENSEYVKFLQNPNGFQNGQDFIKEMVINLLTTGGVFQYGNFFKNGNLRVSPELYNLDFFNLSFPKVTDRYAMTRRDIGDLKIIEKLEGNKRRTMEIRELAFFYDNISHGGFDANGYNSATFFNPMSRLFAVISSLHTLLDSQDSMAYLSGNNVNKIVSKKQSAGAVAPLDGDEKQDIEMKLAGRGKYGSKSGKIGDIVATNEDFSVLDLTRDNRKMQMIEMQENAKENIRSTFLIPKDYFGDSTYENKQSSEARFTLGQVKSITDNWLNELTNKSPGYFRDRGTKLIGRYDHISAVVETQAAIKNRGFKDKTEALKGVMDAFVMMQTIEPGISWEEFLIRNQFTDFLKAQ